MDDEHLERLALICIIAGLILTLLLVPTYEEVDAHYLFEDDNNAFLEGTIQKNTYSTESGWTFLEIRSCRTMNAFYEGEITKKEEDKIRIKGSYYNDAFSIKKYE